MCFLDILTIFQEGLFMKKLFILTLVLLMAIMGTASASKSKFKDPNYDFKNFVNIYLAQATYTPYNISKDFKEDGDPVNRALNAVRTAMAKKNKYLIVPPEEPSRARLDLHLVVHRLGNFTYWREPWVEEVIENEKYEKKDKNGNKTTYTIPVKRVIQHPGKWITDAYAEVEFTLKDRNTGRVVFNLRDDRKREEVEGYDGMLNRIATDFVNDLK